MALETELRKNLQKELRQRCEELNELRKEAIELRSAASQTQKRMIEATRVLSPSLQISPHEVRFLLVCDVDSKRIRSLSAAERDAVRIGLARRAGGGEVIAGAVKAGEGVGVGPGAGKFGKGVPLLVLEHLVFQIVGHSGGQGQFLLAEAEMDVDGTEPGRHDGVGGGIVRHGPDQDGQARGQDIALVAGAVQNGQTFRHGPPPFWSAGS